MSREQLNKHWQMIEAYKNGAEIECFNHLTLEWILETIPKFLVFGEYRVKEKQ